MKITQNEAASAIEKGSKPIRMVVCDLDGTLLYRPGRLSERARKDIRRLREKGILFGVCSGRSAYGLKNMLKVWGIENDVDFVLGFNGGMLYDLDRDEMKTWLELPADVIPEIMKSFKGMKVAFGEYEGNEMLCTADNPVVRQFARRSRLDFKKVPAEELIRPTSKFMAIGLPWVLSTYLNEHVASRDWRMFRSGPFLIEFVHPKLSKLEGVRRIAQDHGLSLDEVLSFGNDNNDLEMLSGTIGVAMKSGLDSVKEAAAFEARPCSEDGVAVFLEEHLLPSNDGRLVGLETQ